MPFTVSINETDSGGNTTFNRLTVTVDSIDINSVFKAVNTPPPAAPKPNKPRSDKGITRGPKTTPAATV